MAFNEHTSRRIASIAGRGLRDLSSVTDEEILEVFASALTQALDHHQGGNAMADGGEPRSVWDQFERVSPAPASGAHSFYNKLGSR